MNLSNFCDRLRAGWAILKASLLFCRWLLSARAPWGSLWWCSCGAAAVLVEVVELEGIPGMPGGLGSRAAVFFLEGGAVLEVVEFRRGPGTAKLWSFPRISGHLSGGAELSSKCFPRSGCAETVTLHESAFSRRQHLHDGHGLQVSHGPKGHHLTVSPSQRTHKL